MSDQEKITDLEHRLAGTEAALREKTLLLEVHEGSEGYRALFDAIDEGLCIIETIEDASGHCTDYRFLQVNAAFERQTGLKNAVGRTVR